MGTTYEIVTDKILGIIASKNIVPWRVSWRTVKGNPLNAMSKKSYSGCNLFFLWFMGMQYDTPIWLSYKQAQELGGSVKKGEQGNVVVFFTEFTPSKEKDLPENEQRKIPMMKYYHVFNIEQCEGIDLDLAKYPLKDNGIHCDFNPIQAAELLVRNYRGPVIEHTGQQPCYINNTDTIRICKPENFESPAAYYASLFHEMAHSTGHKSRLDRDLSKKDLDSYSFEELVAEFAACYLCQQCQIDMPETSPAYIHGWSSKLKANPRWITSAPAAAMRAVECILNYKPEAKE